MTHLQDRTMDRSTLVRDLRALGVLPGLVLAVHASLSRLGWVPGGAETVIAALMQAVSPGGALVMLHDRFSPAYPLSAEDRALGIAWRVRRIPWADLDARTGMGRIADTFARRPDVARGPQREHILVAWGLGAGRLCQGWQGLIDRGGRILMLGVRMDRCSILHRVEQAVALPPAAARRAFPPIPEAAAARYPATEWAFGMQGSGLDFLEVERAAGAAGLLIRGLVGAAPAILLDPAPVLDLFAARLRAEPEAFLYPPDDHTWGGTR